MKRPPRGHALVFAALFAAAFLGAQASRAQSGAERATVQATTPGTLQKGKLAVQGWDFVAPDYLGERGSDRHPVRMSAELALSLGVGALWYWTSVDVNQNDWTYSLEPPSLFTKYVEAEGIRFDDNDHYLNSPGHPAAGAAYYFLSRKNGFNPMESLGATVLTALAWELITEYREVVSINDVITTPLGGLALGEPLFATVSYLQNVPHGAGRAFSGVAHFLDRFHLWLEGNPNPLHEEAHALDFGAGNPSRVDIGAGPLVGLGGNLRPQSAPPGWNLNLQSQIWRLPGLFLPGSQRFFFADTARAELRASAAFTEFGPVDHRVEGSTTLAGLYAQDFWLDDKKRITGMGWLLALQSDFSHVEHDGLNFDRLGRLGVAGLSGQVLGATRGARLSARLDLSPDFALVSSPVILKQRHFLDEVQTKSVLEKEGYVYSAGISADLKVRGHFGPIELFGGAAFRTYESIDGLDREQDHIARDLHHSDRRVEATGGARWNWKTLPIALQGELNHRWQLGSIAHAVAQTQVDILMLSVILVL
jgi:hypothetical protein